MKKSELTQLTQIIEHLVAREVRKQLPAIIAETFKNMMGKSVVTEQQSQPIQEQVERNSILDKEKIDFKASLKELFSGTPVIKSTEQSEMPKPIRQFTKDPVLNQILNETTSDLRQRERLVGGAAFQGGYSPTLSMIPEFNVGRASTGPGPMMSSDEEPSFSRNMPMMPGYIPGVSIPASAPPVLSEGQESSFAPLSSLPEGISALDVVHQVPIAAPVAQALTKNYSQMMKLMDSKRKRI